MFFPLLVLGAAFAGSPSYPCALSHFGPPIRPIPLVQPPASPGDTLLERDAFGDAPSSRTSDHFVLKWGTERNFSSSDVESLLAGFEEGYDRLVLQDGYPAPSSMGAYRFNVYIWGTGFGPDAVDYAGAYYTLDPEGQPMIVVNPDLVGYPDYVRGTAVHEFFHAIQGETGRFSGDPTSFSGRDAFALWYWEATANWAAVQVYPERVLEIAQHIAVYTSASNLPINFFDAVDTGSSLESYQYGASLFPLYLSGEVADPALIQASWIGPTEQNDPLEVLREGLADRGLDLDEVILDHYAKNVGFDYTLGLEEWLQDELRMYWLQLRSPVKASVVTDGGTDGVQRLSEDVPLYRYGAHRIVLPVTGRLYDVRLIGSEQGAYGTEAVWGGRLVRRLGDSFTYEPIVFDGPLAEFQFDSSSVNEAWVVISPISEANSYWRSERYAYGYEARLVPLASPSLTDEVEARGGCNTGLGGSFSFFFPVIIAFSRRRDWNLNSSSR